MTISTQNRTAGPFAGNGVASSFPFTFKVFQASDLKVVRRTISTDTEATLVLNANYTVALNPNQNANPGGSINLPGALSVDETLTITTELAYLQQTELTNQGGFYPQVITNALDRLTIFTQQLFTGLNRSLKYPLSDSGIDPTLPGKNTLRGRVLAFHETTGRPIAGPTTTSVGTVAGGIAAIQTVADNIADVNTVADNIGDVNAVGQSIGDVNDIADNLTAVQTVATNISKVNTVAFNINDVTNFADVYLGPRTADPSTRSDGSPLSQGDLYFNTSTNRLRVYTGTQWSEANAGAVSVQQFTGDGVTVDFQLNSAADNENVVQVFVGGVYQSKTVYDITGANADIITFVSPPPNGVAIEAVTFSVLPLGVVDASQVQMPGGGTLDELGDPGSVVKVGGVEAGNLSYDVLKYGAVQDLPTAGSANMLAFLDALTSSRHVTAKDGVYYVSDTIEVNAYHNLSLPGCTIVTQGMAGKPLFRFKLENPTTSSEQISIDMGGGSIAGDAAYAFEFVGVDTSPSTQEACRIIKITGVTVSAVAMRFAKAVNAAKSLFFTQVWHFGGMFLDTNGKVVETHISNSLIFGSGADTNGFLMESNGGTNQYSEGLHLANCTVDGYENCFNIRDMFVTTLVSAYVGGTKAFLFRPPTTTHNREFNIGAGCVFGGRIVFQDAAGGVSGNGKISSPIFAGAAAPVIEVGTGWSAIDIENVKAESNGGPAGVAVWVKNGCNDINVNGVNADVTFNGGVEFTGANGANCRALNVNAVVGRAVTSARPIIAKNPSLNGVNDIDLHRYSANLPPNASVAVGNTFGTLGISLAKGQTGTITVAGRIGGCAAGQTLLIDGISSLSIPNGAGWSSVYIELPAGEHSFCHTIPFIAKSDIPFLLVGLTNSVGNTVSQNSAHAFITVVKDL